MPVGFSAKMLVNKGDKDHHGKEASKAGWYYRWFRGVHILCGEEGLNLYKYRPLYEDALKKD